MILSLAVDVGNGKENAAAGIALLLLLLLLNFFSLFDFNYSS